MQRKRAVDKQDWNALRSLLDPKASVAVLNAAIYSDRDAIVAGAQAATEQYGIKNIRITSLSSRQDQTAMTVDIDVLSDRDSPANHSRQAGSRACSSSGPVSRVTAMTTPVAGAGHSFMRD